MEQQRSSLGAARRAEFKSPPSGRPGSQDERRAHALEDQKRVCLHIAIRDFPADVFPSSLTPHGFASITPMCFWLQRSISMRLLPYSLLGLPPISVEACSARKRRSEH